MRLLRWVPGGQLPLAFVPVLALVLVGVRVRMEVMAGAGTCLE